MSQQAPVFPKVPLQGLRFRDFEAIKNLRLDLTRSFSRSFQGVFVPIRAVSPNFGMLHFDYWAHHARPSPGWSARDRHARPSPGWSARDRHARPSPGWSARDRHARPSPGWSARGDGGEGWIRTSVRLRGQIYSLLPLTTRPPLHRGHAGPHGQARHVAARQSPVNALHLGECHDAALHSYGVRLRSKIQPSPGWSDFGAGEGNRTLVVSLEGFCSTIELHPLRPKRTGQMAGPLAIVNRRPFLT